MLINPDFRTQLQQVGSDPGGRWFKVRAANRFELLIRPSQHADAGVGFAPEDCERWDIALGAPDRTHATPKTHPPLFPEAAWRQYWECLRPGDVTASGVPTEVVQTLFDFLALGPDLYQEMTSMR